MVLDLGDTRILRCMMPTMSSPGRESESKQLPEAELQATLNTIPAHTWYALPSGALTFVSDRTADYLGLPKDHPLRFGIDSGASWDSHIPRVHPDDQEETRRVWSTCVRTGRAGEASFRVRNAEGEYRWFLSRAEPLRASDGTLLYWIGVNLEIEERKQAEFYLEEGERLGHMGSWVLDPAGFFPYWSHELFHIYGLDPAKEGPSLEEYLAIIHPQDREFMRSLINRMFAEASGCDVSKRIVRTGGEVRYVRCVAVPIVENGVLKRIVGTAMDVTDHEQLAQELQRRQAYLAEAQKLSHTGSFGWKVSSGEIFWSDETFRIFQCNPRTNPTVEFVLSRVHPDDRGLVQQQIDQASRDGKGFDFEHRLQVPDGSIKHVRVTAHPSWNSLGDLEFVGAVTDVTEAKQTEDRIRRIINTVPGLHWSARPDGWVDFINQRWLDYTGMTLEQALGWGWAPAYHPDEIEEVQVKWRTAVAEGTPLEMETRLRRFDGEYRWFLERVFPLFDHAGQIVGWYGSDIDIHDRKQAEDKIRQQEIEVRQIVDLAPQLVSVFGPGRERLYANRVMLDYLGIGLDEWLQRSPGTHTHPDDSERAKACWLRASASGSAYDVELRVRKHDGSYRWHLARYNPVRDDKGQIVRWYVAGTDIEERKRAEEKLQQENVALMRAEQKIREQEAELRQMLDFTPLYLGVNGADGSPLYANQASLDYLGMSLDEWRQKRMDTHVHPDDVERLNRASSGGSACELEVRVRNREGKFRWILARFNPLRDENGQITRWYTASTDIDDRKRAEEKLQQENVALREEIDKASMFEEIVGTSPALKAVLSRISKVAPSDSTVLITGETGTGKELVARAIHRRSNRSSRTFVSVNCAAIPRELIASELFGHEKGAFTGATQQRLGRFELANGGTLFLDEVGDLPAETQIALLRVLQEHEFERVGGTRPIHADVRVIAATNRDLQAAISNGSFRSDLFYRLHVFPIEIPPLRERSEDIPLLVEYFIDRYARKAGKRITTVDKKTLRLLESYPWPGNIRELQNVIERSVIVCETANFSVDESWLSQQPVEKKAGSQLYLSEKVAAQEKELIEAALRECQGRVFGPLGAAAKLGMPRSTLESKIRSLKINKNLFKT
jgi:PAS domain S-box-containing protein